MVLVGTIFCGCASPRTMVVLIPDRDGRVGQAHISTDGGRRLLDQAGQAAVIKSRHLPPEEIAPLADDRIRAIFEDAMAAEPRAPEKFTLHFNHATTRLSSDSLRMLSEIVADIHRRQSRDISINGHTDRMGSKTYNHDLSLQRARAIEALLIKAGIDSAWLSTTSHGEGNPLIQTADDVAEPRNRRVEVIVR
ncbi:MAG: OmpA family protein [Desulfosarcina sp.]